MKINRKLAIKILKYQYDNKEFYFPFFVMCKEYTEDADDFVEIEPDEWETIESDENYQTFELWENLQHLYSDTTRLMAKGFIEKITNENSRKKISVLAKKYRKKWNEDLCESEDIKKFGENEYFGGKAEGFEESLEILTRKF